MRVLLVAGRDSEAGLASGRLGSDAGISTAATAAELERCLELGGWQLVVVDSNTPGIAPSAVQEAVRSRLPGTPVIVVGGEARRRELELLEHNHHLLRETIEQARLFEALRELALASSGELSIERLTALTGQSAKELLGRETEASIALMDETGTQLVLIQDTGGMVAPGTLIPTGTGAAAQAVNGVQPLVINDYQTWPDALPWIVKLGVEALLMAPLVTGRRTIGALTLYKLRRVEFTTRDLEVAMMVASQLAPVVDAARAHADLEWRSARQELVSELGRAAVLGATDQQLAAMALPGLATLLRAESGAILTEGGDHLAVELACGTLAEHAESELITGELGSPGTLTAVQGGHGEGGRRTAVNIEYEGRPAALLLCRTAGPDFAPADLHLLGAVSSILTEASRTAAAERSLRASEERYREIFEYAAEGVWQVDSGGRTLYANRRMAEILRCTAAELGGRTIWDFTEPGSLTAHRQRFAARLRGVSGRYDQEFKAADGTVLTASVAASPIVDHGGGITSVVALVTDLTERRKAEQALRESEEKSRFLAGMSHELRTPLNSILGFSQLLDDPAFGPLTDRQRRYLGHIRSQGQHLLDLISDVLDLSMVSAGRLEMVSEKVDLAVVAADVAARMRPLAENKSQQLEVEVDSGSAATADRLRVTQAVLNLVSNAVKYSPQGGEIGIRVRRRDDRCEIAVTDDGPGIALEDQSLVFDEFSKLSSGRRGEGTGLGLSLTRRLVEAMGGQISLCSRPGEGSVFRIMLPTA